ncbi:hypothetical protein GCM10011369_32280 [Neiella marina]|uniref:DUF1653 domain-containing protein n=1 Tax=Neiella marina TaxID=508461 RepID=A0A8J2U955_9GAMM|nr:DUF1653 domain-containing protein [Neiella marina]GGA87747.1 hypothetical protein GCM10011369_32280 [Neiella marina]
MTELNIKRGKYQHYKGNEYHVLDLVTHSETEETMVLYRPLYGDQKLWVRPYDMFFETVEIDGEVIERFRYLGPID